MERTSKEILEALAGEAVQEYIHDHEYADPSELVLKHKAILGVPSSLLAEQIAGRRKAKEKLPRFYHTPAIIYPHPVNLEQSSSEPTAVFKRDLIRQLLPDGNRSGADLTGGFGVDTFFLSEVLDHIDYVEPQEFLLEIARHNHHRLGAVNISHHGLSAEAFIEKPNETFDFFYIDPSRRTQVNKKIYALEDSEPDVIGLQDRMYRKTPILLVKASPLLDIQSGLAQLTWVKKVCVISVNNDCKEVLFVCEKNFKGDPLIEAVNLLPNGNQTFEFSFLEERERQVTFSDPLQYLYEPNASILKAGAFKSIAYRFNVKKIEKNTHFYTAENLIEEFPGRIFLVEKLIRAERTEVKKYFPDGKANITTRNYPLTVDALKKKTGLKDGGDRFLIGFSGQQKKFLAVARRV